LSSRGVVHYGDMYRPACRHKPFTYFAWSTRDKKKVTCKKCLAKFKRVSGYADHQEGP